MQEEDDEQQFDIGNQDHFDHAPDQFKDHLTQAFVHAAGKGKHPGKYAGPEPGPPPDDAITEGDLQRTHEGEASAKKMQAAHTGGGGTGLGPTDAEQALIKQRSALQQQAGAQAQAQATQAQGAQTSATPPPAPAGPQGSTTPYSAQKGAVGGAGNAPQAQQPPPAESDAGESPAEGESSDPAFNWPDHA